MLAFEETLTDPTPERVAGALSHAATWVNLRQTTQLVRDDPEAWRTFVKRMAKRPEGWGLWRGGGTMSYGEVSLVSAGWWTDPLGRKHAAVRGRRAWAPPPRKELARRPPLWHTYPERCVLRHDAAGTQVICHCACGAVGTPAALGWMGETCGPCFDRREEVGPAGLTPGIPGVFWCKGGVAGVACSPDGNTVFAGTDSRLMVWSPETPCRMDGFYPARNTTGFALTPNCRFLLRSGLGETFGSMFDLQARPPRAEIVAPAVGGPRTGWREFAPLPDPQFVLATYSSGYTECDLQLIRLPAGEVVRSLRVGRSYSYQHDSLAASPDGTLAAFAGEQGAVIDLRAWQILARPNPPAGGTGGAAFAPDGARLFLAGGLDVHAYDAPMWKRAAHGSVRGGFGTAGRNGEWLRGLVVNPATGHLYAAGGLGLVYVFDPGSLELRATLEWHVGPVNGMAMSADGSRLFTAGSDAGVKVWPVRELLDETA